VVLEFFGFRTGDANRLGERLGMRKRRSRLLTSGQAAEYLGVSVLTLYRMEELAVLVPYRTPGRHRRYSIEMLEEYLESSRQRPLASD
jgi:excisionase family DNA binding protein